MNPQVQASDFPFRARVDVRFRDIDALGHVNNAVYFTYFEVARTTFFKELFGRVDVNEINFVLAEATARYYAPAFFGDVLDVLLRVTRVGTKSFTMEYLVVREPDNAPIAGGQSVQVIIDRATQRSAPMSEDMRAKLEGYGAETH